MRKVAQYYRDKAERCRRLRSEEHTSELQSQLNLVCRLLLVKKNDLMRSTPPLRVLLEAFLNAQIRLNGLTCAQDFVDRLHYVDRLLRCSSLPGLPDLHPDHQ